MLSRTFDATLGLPLDTSLTLRLTMVERNRWDKQAKHLSLSTGKYVRLQMANNDTHRKLKMLLNKQQARQEHAALLHMLGKSRIASNLNQLAHAANIGNLVFTPDVVAQINEAYEAIIQIRSLLITGTGSRS